MKNSPLPRRRQLLKLAACALPASALRASAMATLALPGLARARESWPVRPVTLIVPFAPGGTTDLVSRMVARELTKSLGQAVVVENKPGAGTVIGVDAAAKASPDGYTLVCVANSFCANQTLVKKLPYNSTRDLQGVALMGQSEHVLAAWPGAGIKNVADLVAAARRQPGKLSYASFGNGSSAHLAGEMLKAELGIDLVHVPYKGQAPGLNDLLAGHVTLMFGNWPEFRSYMQAGRLTAVGMATARRSDFAPGIPTLAEQGAAIESNSWNGLLVRRGTPGVVLATVNEQVNSALQSAAMVQAFRENGLVSLARSPQQFDAFLASEVARYAGIINKARISLD